MNFLKYITEETKITSDTHFGHKNIEKYEPIRVEIAKRNGIKDSNQLLINNWNEDVNENDYVLHCGDYAFESPKKSFEKIKGNIIIIIGNHDKKKINFFEENFKGVIKEPLLDIEDKEKILEEFDNNFLIEGKRNGLVCCLIKDICGKRVMFSHFPVYDENQYDKKYIEVRKQLEWLYKKTKCNLNVYGHTHSKLSKFPNSVSVTVENTNMRIKKIKEVIV